MIIFEDKVNKALDSIILAWWNTSLSPPIGRQVSEEKLIVAKELFKTLISDLQVDCLALGEVSPTTLHEFMEIIGPDYELFDGTTECELNFNTGIIYRKSKLRLINNSCIETTLCGLSFKVATRLDFMVENIPIHLFVSHWSSRRYRQQGAPERNKFGSDLRGAIDELNSDYGGKPAYSILMGDYNDEPFDHPLAGQLRAVRNRVRIRRNPLLLYNPFWRHLGEAQPYVPGKSDESYVGTNYYGPDTHTQWRTFDQIIFSAPFICDGEWQLNEEYTQILQCEPFTTVFLKDKSFDHFPVMSVIERRILNG